MLVVEVWTLVPPSASRTSAGRPESGSVMAAIEAHVVAAYWRRWRWSPPPPPPPGAVAAADTAAGRGGRGRRRRAHHHQQHDERCHPTDPGSHARPDTHGAPRVKPDRVRPATDERRARGQVGAGARHVGGTTLGLLPLLLATQRREVQEVVRAAGHLGAA